eukprot:jgi/Botrbrau1/9270/Bobra.180_1s0027.1
MPQLPTFDDIERFTEDASEVARLVDGLRSGSLPTDYIDKRIEDRNCKAIQREKKEKENLFYGQRSHDPERQRELKKKVAELKAHRAAKERARKKYEKHVAAQPPLHQSTDYTKWDLWTPSDEEDELFNSCTPNTPEFRGLEKDIEDRHKRMVEQRQLGERHRVAGNQLYKQGRLPEAIREYEAGLEHDRHNMALHANASLCCLRTGCYADTIQHADRVFPLSPLEPSPQNAELCALMETTLGRQAPAGKPVEGPAEFLHNRPDDPLCVKALQRRAAARRELKHFKAAMEDLQKACALAPSDSEVQAQLVAARKDFEEHQKGKRVQKRLEDLSGDRAGHASELSRLIEVKELAQKLKDAAEVCAKGESGPKGIGAQLGREGALKAKALKEVATACAALEEHMGTSEDSRLLLRECGGLPALTSSLQAHVGSNKHMVPPPPPGPRPQEIWLLPIVADNLALETLRDCTCAHLYVHQNVPSLVLGEGREWRNSGCKLHMPASPNL